MYSAEMKTGEKGMGPFRQMMTKKSGANRQQKKARPGCRALQRPMKRQNVITAGTILLDHVEHPLHPLLPVAFEEEELLGAVKRVGTGPGRHELDHFRLLAQ